MVTKTTSPWNPHKVWIGLAVATLAAVGAVHGPCATPAGTGESPTAGGVRPWRGPGIPKPFDDPRSNDIRTVAAAGLHTYRRSLPEWEGTFLVRDESTEAMEKWAKSHGFGSGPLMLCKRIHAARSGRKWRVDVSYLDDKGQATETVSNTWDGTRHRSLQKSSDGRSYGIIESTPVSVFGGELDTVESLLTASDLDNFDFDLAYYAGISKIGARDTECYVRSSDVGWRAIWLDPRRSYAPVRVVTGSHRGPDSSLADYADWRQDELGRWVAYSRVEQMSAPDRDELGKTVRVQIETLKRQVSDQLFDGPEFPTGTEVWDREKGTQYVVGADS